MTPIPRYRVGFVVEQVLGHITHGHNLRRVLDHEPSIEAQWILPEWMRHGLAGRLPIYRSNWTVQAGLQTRRGLNVWQRRWKPQALFFHTQVTATLSPDWLRRIPSLVSLDATPRQMDRLGAGYQHAAGPAWLEQLKWRLNRNTFRLARHLVAWSAWAKDGLVAEYEVPEEKVSVIPPGVDVPAFASPARYRETDAPIRILFVGGDFERKGGRVLLEAFRRLRQTVATGEHLAGTPLAAQEAELHLVTRVPPPPEAGVVAHTGLGPNDDALRQLYGSADIFCLPTMADCLPLALMEAGAAGLPLVATDLAAIPEIVRDGRTGLLVRPGDPMALERALGSLLADRPLRLALGACALELVRRDFDAQKNAQRLLACLKSLTDEQ